VHISSEHSALASAVAASLFFVATTTAQAQTLNDVATCFADQVADPATSKISGIATVVVVDDRVVLRRGFGTVAPGNPRPVTGATRFRTGSTLKMMTATGVLSLADAGRLRLGDSASALVPGLAVPGRPGWLPQVTVQRLISHQGALKDYNAVVGPTGGNALQDFFRNPTQAATVPLIAPPGRFWNYSNTNFMLAGAIAENVARKPYRQVMSERVFGPLGMHRMTFDAAQVVGDGDFAYGISGASLFGPTSYENGAFEPAGLAWGSADDLAQFARFLIRGNTGVLAPGTWQALRSPQVNTFELLDLERYGYGVFAYEYAVVNDRYHPGVPRREHGGFVPGFVASIVTLPAQRFGMVVLGNGETLDARTCVRKAIAATVGDRLPAPAAFPDLRIRPERFGDFVGWYNETVSQSAATVGPHLIAQGSDGSLRIAFPLLDGLGIPYSPTLIPIFEDAFVVQIQGFGFILKGFRGIGASNPQTEYVRSRLFVGARLGYIPNLPALPQDLRQRDALKRRILDKLRDTHDDRAQQALELAAKNKAQTKR
jgi:CubicO group peptidase (beta-lactamase class C family)